MITLGIFILACMGIILLVLLDTLVYHLSFLSALFQLFSMPSHSSAAWFLGAALFTAGWSDLKNTAFIQRLNLMMSRIRG
ncbi:MAG: hypothetical protein K6T94_19250 [Paenibacillus sp.]|nr:hypothetical protein [Paenibacillus sp.]